MAIVFDGTRIADADSIAPTTPVAGDWGHDGGGGTSLETNFFYEGTNSVSQQVKTTEAGIWFIPDSATYDASGSNLVFLLKGMVLTSGILQTARVNGQQFQIGSGATTGRPTNFIEYHINTQSTYPPTTSWILHAFDVNEVGFYDVHNGGSTSLSAINFWGHVATMVSTAAKFENIGMDAIDYITNGKGLTWTGSDGSFSDFVIFDEGQGGSPENRMGIISTKNDVIYCLAVLTIGSSTATTFVDANQKLIFPWTYVGEGAQGIDIDLQNASTAVTFNVCSFTGKGQSSVKKFFDTDLQVDAGTDYITLPGHGLNTGDYITYSREGGSFDIGPEPGDHWVFVATVDTFGLCTSRTNAYAGTLQALTSDTGGGENQSVIRHPDNRIDFTVTGTTSTAGFVSTSCIYEGIRVMTLTSKCAITGGFIQSIGNIVASTATLNEVAFSSATLEEGYGLFAPLSTFSNISECSFLSSGDGHVAEITSTGSIDSDLNTFTNYWAPTISGDAYGWSFHTNDGISSSIITTNAAHDLTTGDAVFYNNEGGSVDVNLTDGYKYYVDVASTTTFTLHLTKAAAVAGSSIIALSASGTEIHSIYSGNAVLYNNSGGHVTVNVLNDGDTPSVRNGTGSTSSVINTKTLTVTCLNTSGLATQGVRVRIETQADGSLISEGETNGSGVYENTGYAFTAEVLVTVKARLKGFKFNQASDTIRSTGLSIPFTMVKDPAVNLP